MTIPERIDAAIKAIESNFEGGLSNTSTKKFDELVVVLSEMTSIPTDDIYPTSVVKRASNVWNRLSQGKPLNKHFPLAVVIGAHGDEGGIMAPLGSFIGPGFVHYDNIAIIVPDTDEKWSLCDIVTNATDGCSLSLLKEYPYARVHIVNKAVRAQEDVVRAALFSDLENKFLAWLPDNGVVSSAEKYVRNLKAISEPQEPHTATGRWPGFFKDLTGDDPTPVFSVKSEQQFDDDFAKVIPFFMAEYADKEAISVQYPNPEFGKMFDFMHAAPSMNTVAEKDGQFTRGGFRKFRLFLHELEDEVHAPSGVKFDHEDFLAAIRTKPFVLLAGISGTGKSRLVRQLARGCCPKVKTGGGDHPLYDEGKPGNFEMIQVRPNWHDSSELMGYVSRIVKAGDPPKYVMTPFVEFLAKAWVYREVPFFLCLDEMNLAPVEQYFAEYLSVIETRKKQTLGLDGATFEAISTDPLVRWESLEKDTLENAVKELFEGKEWAAKAVHGRVEEVEKLILHDKGIRIPSNLVVMGTVNMDETTCSFSRKVLDRAMTFELNEVADMYDPAKLAAETECEFGTIPATEAEAKLLTGKEAYDSAPGQSVAITTNGTKVGDAILKILEVLNEKEAPAKKDDGSDDGGTMSLLAKTPFKIAYRTRNEIMIYCVERIGKGVVTLPQALDEAISMKILSRIEGDSQYVQKKWLVTLSAAIESELSKLDGYDTTKCTLCKSKLVDMAEQADYGYTSFWTR